MQKISLHLNEIYALYSQKRYPEAFKKVQEILKKYPENPYAKRYEQLLKPYLNDKTQVGKIATVKGKKLKCPHCEATISLSALNSDQREKIHSNNYSNLAIKCPYCHSQFTLQKKTTESILGIKLGDEVLYNGKKYKVTGSVWYTGWWYESNYSGGLKYLEWILLGEDMSYLYFSEGFSTDDNMRKYEYEFSQKVVPDFSMTPDYIRGYVLINGKKIGFTGKNKVSAKKLYGENSKVFTVGEKVELYEFSYRGSRYVLEKEQAGRQSEAGVYQYEKVSRKDACNLFNKPIPLIAGSNALVQGVDMLYPLGEQGGIVDNIKSSIQDKVLGITVVVITASMGNIIITVLLVFVWVYYYFFTSSQSEGLRNSQVCKVLFSVLVVGPALGFLVVPFVANAILDSNKIVDIDEIGIGSKYKLVFDEDLYYSGVGLFDVYSGDVTEEQRLEYDVASSLTDGNKKKLGLQFSIISEKDKEVMTKIYDSFDISPSMVEMLFRKGKIYKLR